MRRLLAAWALLLLPLAGPVPAAAQSEETEIISDGTNDVELSSRWVPQAEVGPLPNHGAVDVLKVVISEETTRHLALRLELDDFGEGAGPIAHLAPLSRATCGGFSPGWPIDGMAMVEYEVGWRHAASEHWFRAWVSSPGALRAGGGFEAWPHLAVGCFERCLEERRSCETMEVPFELDAASDAVTVRVVKPFMHFDSMYEPYKRSQHAFAIRKGDSLDGWTGAARMQFRGDGVLLGFATGVADVWAEDRFSSDKAHALAVPTENADVILSLDQGRRPSAVLGGQQQNYQLMVVNRAPERRLVRLTYEFQATAGWEIAGPPSVAVPAGTARNLTLAVTAPKAGTPPLELRVLGESVGFPEELGGDNVSLRPIDALRPTQDQMYIHYRAYEGGNGVLNDLFALPLCTLNPCGSFMMSFSQADPRAAEPNEGDLPALPGTDGKRRLAWGPYADPVPLPFILNSTARPSLELQLKGSQAVSAITLQATLQAYGSELGYVSRTLATLEAAGSLTTDWQTFTLEGSYAKRLPKVFPKGTLLWSRIEVNETSDGVGPPVTVSIRGAQSFFTLPVLPLPKEIDPTVVPKSFQWLLPPELDDFVNPGETRLFEFSLLNHRAETHRATLRVASQVPEGWSAEILPGKEFELESGAVVKLGLPVKAPSTAKEGDRFNVTLEVMDEANQTSNVTFRLLVLEGADVADDVDAYEVDDEAEKRLVKEAPKETPSLTALTALVLALVVLGGARRRPT